MAGRTLDAGLRLLDRQLIDVEGRFAGKVDDLELTVPDEGPPYVTSILAGPGSLAQRIGGRFGAWIESAHHRLHPSETPGPASISWGVVHEVGSAILLSVPKSVLEVERFEMWTRDHVIGKIPGSEHAPD
jgi:sporulation protein YlmC with PRC-barrel domain